MLIIHPAYRQMLSILAFVFALMIICGTIMMICSLTNYEKTPKQMTTTVQTTNKNELSSLRKATAWLNSSALTPKDLKGKVVLVQFCTYTCINWLRTLPYTRAWAEKYKDKGLVVIGVHAPEFTFEYNINNVRISVQDMKITYPIAMDNNYDIWRSFNNHYWPAIYLVDVKGQTRYQHFGEGNYEESEKMIRQLLTETGLMIDNNEIASVNASGVEVAADWDNLGSKENYLGYERTENFASPVAVLSGERSQYVVPPDLNLNQWAIAGEWTMYKQHIVLHKGGGRIVYRFHSRDLHLVMGPSIPGTTVRFRVLIDGKAPENIHGIDTDKNGVGIVSKQRLYQLIRQQGSITDRQFEIEFLDPGIEAFAFTFG